MAKHKRTITIKFDIYYNSEHYELPIDLTDQIRIILNNNLSYTKLKIKSLINTRRTPPK